MDEHRHPAAVFFDRDGTLVHDVPYNGDPELVVPVDGARDALDLLRRAGVRIGMVTNQSGVARGLLTLDDVARVNARAVRLLGPFDCIEVCPHAPFGRCSCRKPEPGLVARAAAHLGLPVGRCAVVGDRPSDVGAALAAGATAVLVPSRDARDLLEAVEGLLTGRWRGPT